jgi:hypothetical protein
MAVRRKLKKILEEQFPKPDKVELREGNPIVGIVTSKQFSRMEIMKRQDLLFGLLRKNLTEKEQRDVLMIVAVTPEEAIAYSADMD